jgi:predicted N-formylglutamate amidohydrolase
MSAPNLSEAERNELVAAAVTVRPAGLKRSPLVLICEHAGKSVPAPWRGLDVHASFLDTHFGWDIGAGALTELLAGRLQAPAIMASYSRLFLDINRSPMDWDCLRPDMGGIPVPGNLGVTPEDRALREEIARVPFDSAVGSFLAAKPAVVSIHSFTPVMGGKPRPTDIGVLWRKECRMGDHALRRLRSHGGFIIGSNDPYDWHLSDGYALRHHGLERGLACLYLEIRNDLLRTREDLMRVADALAPALEEERRLMDSGSSVTIEIG